MFHKTIIRHLPMRLNRYCAVMLAGFGLSSPLLANVKMPAIFGDHMVLQQGMDLPVWGWADPGEAVTVMAAGERATTTAGTDGKWSVKLKAISVGSNPIEMEVAGKNRLKFNDVLVGDVWVCSGQSNMEFPLNHAHNAKTELPKANCPTMRFFTTAKVTALEPQADCGGQWVVCTPETAAPFTAVGYFFGKYLNEKLNIPVGLIDSSWGGTPAQAWTSMPTLQKHPELKEYVDSYDNIKKNSTQLKEKYKNQLAVWKEKNSQWQRDWKQAAMAAPEVKEELKRNMPHPPANITGNHAVPSSLFNSKIAPLIPFGIKGAIWYQGEANASKYVQYRTLFPAMIADWRQAWGQGDFPFLFVQLANYGKRETQPTNPNWAGQREAQTKALALPKTGMAVIIDIGQSDNIHPKDKMDVGNRLAISALHVAYGQDLVYSGSMYDSMKIEGDRIRITFKHVGSGLMIGAVPSTQPGAPQSDPASELKGFAMAGADKQFVWAKARIEGNSVLVWSDDVKQPVAVRYGWGNNPEVNLYNNEALPASPFRTDDWGSNNDK